MDIMLTLSLAAFTLAGWWLGALKARAQLWIRIGVGPATLWLGFYFIWQLMMAAPTIHTGEASVGWPTLPFMIGGVCALLSSPRADDGNTHQDNGAAAC
jgi:hypothetical protein